MQISFLRNEKNKKQKIFFFCTECRRNRKFWLLNPYFCVRVKDKKLFFNVNKNIALYNFLNKKLILNQEKTLSIFLHWTRMKIKVTILYNL